MAQVLIIGASKGIGLETTRQALEAGHTVCAFARSAAGIRISDEAEESSERCAEGQRGHGGGYGDERRDPGVGRRPR